MRKPSPAMLVALAVLFVAQGGVGMAASTGGNLILWLVEHGHRNHLAEREHSRCAAQGREHEHHQPRPTRPGCRRGRPSPSTASTPRPQAPAPASAVTPHRPQPGPFPCTAF